jgi:hypothetical protein
VLFRNLTTSVVGVPAGTIVQTTSSPVVHFATIADGVAAAGVGKTLDVPVQALDKGSAGNLPADRLIAIVGSLGTRLAVTNPDATSGGTDQRSAMPTAGDRLRLHDALLGDLKQKALLQFPASLSPGDVLFPDGLAVAQVLEEVYIPATGQPGLQLTLTLRIEFQVQYARGQDLRSLAGAVMDADLPARYLPAGGSLEITVRKPPASGSDGATHWEILAVRPLLAFIDGQQAAQLVQGLNIQTARQKLAAQLPLDGKPEISMSPSWWPWLPWLSFRIAAISN